MSGAKKSRLCVKNCCLKEPSISLKKVRISLETAHENLILFITQIKDKEEYKIKELKVIWQG